MDTKPLGPVDKTVTVNSKRKITIKLVKINLQLEFLLKLNLLLVFFLNSFQLINSPNFEHN